MKRGATRELIVGTRASALALAQTELVCAALREVHPGLALRVERITTTGDRKADVPLAQLGRGMFVTEIETALREQRIDFAVHSAKDLPSTLAADLALAAFLPRADARDVLVSRKGGLRELPAGTRIGTSSPRRVNQIRALRPDVIPVQIRGNVDTRIRKLHRGEFDALLLAAAGLARLGRLGEVTEWLDANLMIPCVGQGALAVECRAADDMVIALLRALDDSATRIAVLAERAFLAELGAGCRAAAAAHARVEGATLQLTAMIGAEDGRQVSGHRTGDVHSPAMLGTQLAHELLLDGGAEFLAPRPGASALTDRHVVLTRPEEQSRELAALLRARGASVVSCPTIAIQAAPDTAPLDDALARAERYGWIVFTSANAVDAVADRLEAEDKLLPTGTQLAAVGDATARRLAERIRPASFLASVANGATLGAELPLATETPRILFPRGDRAMGDVASVLRQRGAHVDECVVYHTVAGPGVRRLAALVRGGTVDAIVFASPSSVRFAKSALSIVPPTRGTGPALVCIGPTTARALQEALGVEPDDVADTQTVGGIVESLERTLAARRADAQVPA